MAKKAHFIGICGVGMAGTAELLRELGWEISGSDDAFYPPISNYLTQKKIPFKQGYSKGNIPHDVDWIVVGKHAKLSPDTNEEVQAALVHGIPIKSFPDVLEEITKERDVTVVAGNHGKSTSTALLAHCLLSAGKNPGYFVGAVPHQSTKIQRDETRSLRSISNIGKDKVFIIEGDEYPSSHWDQKSKFLHYHPRDILLTGAAHDHVNVFETLAHYLEPFEKLLSEVPAHGLVVACIDGENIDALLPKIRARVVTYGMTKKADYRAEEVQYGKETTFKLIKNGRVLFPITTSLLGVHNIENIVGVAAFLLEKKLLTPEELVHGIASFEGLRRRLDSKTAHSSVSVYEGFGSSYSKAKSAIDAIRLHFPEKKLIVVFEPHTFSWRNRDTLHWYDDVFKGSDRIVIYKPSLSNQTGTSELDLPEIVARILKTGQNVIGARRPGKVLSILDHELGPRDAILMLSSGELGGLPDLIPNFVEHKFPARP